MEAMSYAIDVGYRHIDTAHLYTTEPEVGYIVRKMIKEGVVKREDMFITTKVWQHNHRPADVEASVRGSLQRMGLDYLDLVLIHWPMSISEDGVDEKIDYLETWSGFESVLKQGLVKSIGVSNFNVQQMERLLKNCQVKPVVNQIELNINLAHKELVSYCQKKDVLCVAYTPFGSMMPGRYDKKHGKTVGQVALRYLYERGFAAIPKTVTRSRVVENACIFDFKLDDSDIETLEKFDKNYHSVPSSVFQNYDNYPWEKIDNYPILDIPLALLKWEDRVKIEL